MSVAIDVRRVITTTVAELRASGDTGMVENLLDADGAVGELIAALRSSREVLATALKASAPDWFETEADIASHTQIKKIDAALKRAVGAA
ncbi:hypothetical protein MUG10_01105 [Xanthomonas prunicola]|uniref:hypothetical protein n=1 Tax=Xanthomonas prunicola TaxID=2053930 RepID=UPI002078FDC4|nr:hypothetical protein [Xanthomonas prunicola]USJ00895.1 hypothetical protein MUG10_01105 [Xanthomonas prunicola]